MLVVVNGKTEKSETGNQEKSMYSTVQIFLQHSPVMHVTHPFIRKDGRKKERGT